MSFTVYDNKSDLPEVGVDDGDEALVKENRAFYERMDFSTVKITSWRINSTGGPSTTIADDLSSVDSFSIEFWNTPRQVEPVHSIFTASGDRSNANISGVGSVLTSTEGSPQVIFSAPYDSARSSIMLTHGRNDYFIADSAFQGSKLHKGLTVEYWYNKENAYDSDTPFSVKNHIKDVLKLDKDGIIVHGVRYSTNGIDTFDKSVWTHNAISTDGFDWKLFKNKNEIELIRESAYTFFHPVTDSAIITSLDSFGRENDAAFAIKAKIVPGQNYNIFSLGSALNKVKVETIESGNKVRLSAGADGNPLVVTSDSLSSDSHTISWDVSVKPGRIRLWIDSSYQGSASNSGLARNTWAEPLFTPLSDHSGQYTGTVTPSPTMLMKSTQDRTDGAEQYDHNIFPNDTYQDNEDGTFTYYKFYPNVFKHSDNITSDFKRQIGYEIPKRFGGRAAPYAEYTGWSHQFHPVEKPNVNWWYGSWKQQRYVDKGSNYAVMDDITIKNYGGDKTYYFEMEQQTPTYYDRWGRLKKGTDDYSMGTRLILAADAFTQIDGVPFVDSNGDPYEERLGATSSTSDTDFYSDGQGKNVWYTNVGSWKSGGLYYTTDPGAHPTYSNYYAANGFSGGSSKRNFRSGGRAQYGDGLVMDDGNRDIIGKNSRDHELRAHPESPMKNLTTPPGSPGSAAIYPYNRDASGNYRRIQNLDTNYKVPVRQYIISETSRTVFVFSEYEYIGAYPFPRFSDNNLFKVIITKSPVPTYGTNSGFYADDINYGRNYYTTTYYCDTWADTKTSVFNMNNKWESIFDGERVVHPSTGNYNFTLSTGRDAIAYSDLMGNRSAVYSRRNYGYYAPNTWGSPGSAVRYFCKTAGLHVCRYYTRYVPYHGDHRHQTDQPNGHYGWVRPEALHAVYNAGPGKTIPDPQTAPGATCYRSYYFYHAITSQWYSNPYMNAYYSPMSATYHDKSNQVKIKFGSHTWDFNPSSLYKLIPAADLPDGGIGGSGAIGDSNVSGSILSNLYVYPQTYENYDSSFLSVGRDIYKFNSSLQTGTTYAQEYVAASGGNLITYSGTVTQLPTRTDITSVVEALQEGDALVLPPGAYAYTLSKFDQDGNPAPERKALLYNRSVLITGQTNDPSDVNFQGTNVQALVQETTNGQLAFLTYMTKSPFSEYTCGETDAKVFNCIIDHKDWGYPYLNSEYTSPSCDLFFQNTFFKNYKSFRSADSKRRYNTVMFKDCVFDKEMVEFHLTDPRRNPILIGRNLFKVDDITTIKQNNKNHWMVNNSIPSETKSLRYIKDFMIHDSAVYFEDSIYSDSYASQRLTKTLFDLQDSAPFDDVLRFRNKNVGSDYQSILTVLDEDRIISTRPTSNTDWQHVSINYSAGRVRSFIDGSLVDSVGVDSTTFTSLINLSTPRLGQKDSFNTSTGVYDASMGDFYLHEFMIFDSSLDSSVSSFSVPSKTQSIKPSTIVLTATDTSYPVNEDISPYTAGAKQWKKMSFVKASTHVDSAFEALTISIGGGHIGDGDIVQGNNETITNYFDIDSFARPSGTVQLLKVDDAGDSIDWTFIRHGFSNPILKIGKSSVGDSYDTFYVKAYDLSESNFTDEEIITFIGKHTDSGDKFPLVGSLIRDHDSYAGDILIDVQYSGEGGLLLIEPMDHQFLRWIEIDSVPSTFDSSTVTFDPFTQFGGII